MGNSKGASQNLKTRRNGGSGGKMGDAQESHTNSATSRFTSNCLRSMRGEGSRSLHEEYGVSRGWRMSGEEYLGDLYCVAAPGVGLPYAFKIHEVGLHLQLRDFRAQQLGCAPQLLAVMFGFALSIAFEG